VQLHASEEGVFLKEALDFHLTGDRDEGHGPTIPFLDLFELINFPVMGCASG